MKLCFATQNRNKLKEIQAIIPADFELITPEEFGCTEELPETSNTLEGDRKSTRLNSSHLDLSRMPSSA